MNKITLLIGLCIALSYSACTTAKQEKVEAPKFTTTSALVMDTSFNKEYVAQIQSIQNVEIRSKLDGYIDRINVDEGQHVNAGQVLFNIMPKEYLAELAEAKAKVRTAEIEWQNVKVLADKNIVSNTELALAQAKLDEAKAAQAVAELNVSFTEIKAPFEGTIDRIHFKIGSLINEGTLLTSLSNNSDVFAYFNVSEIEYLDYKSRNKNKVNDQATLLLANNQPHKYKGTIETIEGEFDNTTGNIAFRAKFPNPDLLLKHGETGKVQLAVELKNVLVIPQKATYEIQDKIFVYVVDQNGVVKSRNIVIKQKLQNLYVIESGITTDDKILLEGLQSVKEDDKIEAEYIAPAEVISHLQLINK